MFKEMKDKKKISYSNVLQKLTQENVAKYNEIEKILSERNKLRTELIQIKEEKLCGQKQIFQENTKLKTKLFLTEQKLQKTQNLYEILKKKLKKRNERNLKNGETSNTRSKSQNIANYKKKKQKNNFTNPTIPNERSNYDMNINKKVFGKII